VNQFHGIRPQTPGKKILVDGHQRLEALKFLGEASTPIYKGTYTGNAEKSIAELKDKTAIEGDGMNKVAEYKDQIYKVAMARAWKKNIGELSDIAKNKLKDAGILNHVKELAGLKKGTENIVKKYEGRIVENNPDAIVKVTNDWIKHDPIGKKLTSGTSRKDIEAANRRNYELEGGFMSFVGHNPKHRIISKGDIYAEGSVIKDMMKLPPKGSQDSDYMSAIMNRHEADELRHGVRNINNKKNSLGYKGSRIGLGQVLPSHQSPKVMYSESAHTAIAPDKVKEAIMNARKKTGEVEGYKAYHGLDYGKSGVFDAKGANKANRSVVKQNKPFYKDMLED
jgi:phage-related protein